MKCKHGVRRSDGGMSRTPSVSESLREVAPLTEVASRLRVSRPTLYRYIDLYDRGETGAIPGDVLRFLDQVTSGRTTADQDRISLIQGTLSLDGGSFDTEDGWSGGAIGTICVGQGGRAMVLFRDAFNQPDWTRVVVSVRIGPECTDIGTFVPAEGRRYVVIDDLIPKLDYRYRVEQGAGGSVAVSETLPLQLRRGRPHRPSQGVRIA